LESDGKTYDYIIAGGGLAGLSLAYKLNLDPHFKEKQILIIDKDAKEKNDRTWCFWSKEAGCFDEVLFHQWENLSFKSDTIDKVFKTEPYTYKMIRGIDFYKFAKSNLLDNPNVDFVLGTITQIEETKEQVQLHTETTSYSGQYLFKSYPDKLDDIEDHFVWQHFKGIIIETQEDSFDPHEAILMDFRIVQNNETRFFYVLPTSRTRALVEMTIFSKNISEGSYYDSFLENYISSQLGIKNYKIIEEELGAIPMTTHVFQNTKPSRIKSIGTNGGSVKASSGYAFTRIQKHIDLLIESIKKDKIKSFRIPKTRYQLYDRIMMNAILTEKTTGKKVFENLFNRLGVQTIFKFLDEEKDIVNDLKIFSAPPKLPFIKAYFEEISK